MSFVDVQPSESMRLKVRSVARWKISCAFPETIASVITTDNIVASAGANIPAPLAIPANCVPSTDAVEILGTESVVMIACALPCKPSSLKLIAIESSPEAILSIGRSSPIRPVEQTITSPDETLSNWPTCSAVLCVSAKP